MGGSFCNKSVYLVNMTKNRIFRFAILLSNISMKNFALLLLFLTFSLSVSAQVYIQNTMYRYTPVLYNPAAAGMTQTDDQGMKLSFLGRLQWVGIEGAPRTSAVSADMALKPHCVSSRYPSSGRSYFHR